MTDGLRADPRAEIRKAIDNGNTLWLLERAGELHGHYCPGLAYGVRAAYRASADLKGKPDISSPEAFCLLTVRA